MAQKLPGYNQAQKLIKLYRKAGFTDSEIAEQLTILEELIFAELVSEIEKGMSEEGKRQLDKFLEKSPSPEAIAKFLQLDKGELSKKIERKIQEFVDQLTEDITKAELSLEELKSALLNLKIPKEQKPEESTQETGKANESLFQKILARLRGA